MTVKTTILLRFGRKEENSLYLLFPHGFKHISPYLDIIRQYNVELLITSFSLFQLPFFLGGKVNPGPENAYQLVKDLNPKRVIKHNMSKNMKQLV